MILNVEQTVINYINKFGFLFENDTLLLLEDVKLNKKIKEIKTKYKKKNDDLKKYRDDALDKTKEIAISTADSQTQEYADELNEKILDMIEEKKQRIKQLYFIRSANLNAQQAKEIEKAIKTYKTTKIISGIALASLIIYTSYQIYKDTNNKYQKNCEKKPGKIREKCILNNRIISLKKRLDFLNGASIKCNKSKDPVKCKDKLDEEILKIKEKIEEQIKNIATLAYRTTEIGY